MKWTGEYFVPGRDPFRYRNELQEVVTGAFGFDQRPQAVPHFRRKGAGQRGTDPLAVSSPSFNPTDLAGIYQFPTGVTGAGETIGIIELGGGFNQADLDSYFSQLGVSPAPSVTAISVDGGSNQSTGDPTSADGEVELDIEVVGSIAPGANQKVFFGPNTTQGFLDAISQAVHDPTVTLISISWGQAESEWAQQALTTYDQTFQDAATLGKTVFVAAGDNGSSDGVTDGQNHVDFPASSPFAVACGGTTLQASNGQITSETVWNEQASGNGATGGGVSDFFALPSYQQSSNVPAATTSTGGRGVPDVAADADPETGYNVLIDGQNTVIGGTSAVAPLYAGLFALINQTLVAQGKERAGLVQPVLYANGQGFQDITQGNNGAFSAGPGWDATTGLGSPNGQQILAAFLALAVQNATESSPLTPSRSQQKREALVKLKSESAQERFYLPLELAPVLKYANDPKQALQVGKKHLGGDFRVKLLRQFSPLFCRLQTLGESASESRILIHHIPSQFTLGQNIAGKAPPKETDRRRTWIVQFVEYRLKESADPCIHRRS